MDNKFAFSQGEWLLAAYQPEHFPQVMDPRGQVFPEIAIVGRSNVGKSSLINHLLKQNRLAKVSSTPGKTQSINFFNIDQKMLLVDLPGYGYAKVPLGMKEEWSRLISSYIEKRSSLRLILFLLDCRHPPSSDDIAFLKWAVHHKKPVLFVFTKTDKLKSQERTKLTLEILQAFQPYLHEAPVHFLHYSIKDPNARIELIQKINAMITPWDSSTKTPSSASTAKQRG